MCTRNPNESSKKLLELISTFSYISAYKVNLEHQLCCCMLALNKWKVKLMKQYSHCGIKSIKHQGIYLTKYRMTSAVGTMKHYREISKKIYVSRDGFKSLTGNVYYEKAMHVFTFFFFLHQNKFTP